MDKSKRIIDFTAEELELFLINILAEKLNVEPPRFIPEEEARKLLNCGKTQMYHYRVRGKIGYVQSDENRKMILYDRLSILNFLESNLKKAF